METPFERRPVADTSACVIAPARSLITCSGSGWARGLRFGSLGAGFGLGLVFG
jgi:hypothetical protein